MFKSLIDDIVSVTADVATIAVAPVASAVAVAKEMTKPIADTARDVVNTLRKDSTNAD